MFPAGSPYPFVNLIHRRIGQKTKDHLIRLIIALGMYATKIGFRIEKGMCFGITQRNEMVSATINIRMSRIGLVVLAILLFVGSLERPSGVSLFCMSGSKWGGKRCDCEPGMINVNGKCSCDYGYSPTSKGC